MWKIHLANGIRVVVTVEGTPNLSRMIDRRKWPLQHLTPLFQSVASAMRDSFSDQFAKGGDPAWTPLSPVTIALKRRKGLPKRTADGQIPQRLVQNGQFGPQNILIATGALRDSYAQLGSRGHVERMSAFAVEVGSDIKVPDGSESLARIHQYGAKFFRSSRGKSGRAYETVIPARPLRMREEDVKAISRLVWNHMTTEV